MSSVDGGISSAHVEGTALPGKVVAACAKELPGSGELAMSKAEAAVGSSTVSHRVWRLMLRPRKRSFGECSGETFADDEGEKGSQVDAADHTLSNS